MLDEGAQSALRRRAAMPLRSPRVLLAGNACRAAESACGRVARLAIHRVAREPFMDPIAAESPLPPDAHRRNLLAFDNAPNRSRVHLEHFRQFVHRHEFAGLNFLFHFLVPEPCRIFKAANDTANPRKAAKRTWSVRIAEREPWRASQSKAAIQRAGMPKLFSNWRQGYIGQLKRQWQSDNSTLAKVVCEVSAHGASTRLQAAFGSLSVLKIYYKME